MVIVKDAPKIEEQMGKIKAGGYIFRFWKGDHPPRHVHIFRKERVVVIWNLEDHVPIQGYASRKIRKLIIRLVNEGKLK